MNTNYIRIIPRDLFNESKLLKCIGRLVLLIHDGYTLNNMEMEHDNDAFEIGLTDDGFLTITNIVFTINNKQLFLKSLYNSKDNFPLFLEYDYCDYLVFDENGNYTDDFKNTCNLISKSHLTCKQKKKS